MAARNKLTLTIVLMSLAATACGPRRLALPGTPGTSSPDAVAIHASARARCEAIHTLQAELNLSGRAGTQRVRGRVLAGIVPGALRLEGVVPFGSPAFILVADGAHGTLLLPRDRRIVRDAPPEEILAALVGFGVGPDDLRALLAGCVRAAGDVSAGHAHGDRWRSVELRDGGTVFLTREADTWRIVAGRYAGLLVEYPAFNGEFPSRVSISGERVNLSVAVGHMEANGTLTREALIALKVTSDLQPLTVDELRRAGPLGE